MKLLIDIGNSRIKICYSQNDELVNHAAAEYDQSSMLAVLSKLAGFTPDEVIISSVSSESNNQHLIQWSQAQWNIHPVFAKVTKEFNGLKNAYNNIGQYGVDRWLAMIAARTYSSESVLIVDCGTAITLDAIEDSGNHLGGLIIPGIDLMQTLLTSNTEKIEIEREIQVDDKFFGQSTEEGLYLGAQKSIIGLIELSYQQMQEIYNTDIRVLLTGGAAPIVISALSMIAQHKPHLVLEGLEIWSKFK